MKLEWKVLVLKLWGSGVKGVLEEISKDSANKWDDEAIKLLDVVINRVLS